MSITKKVAHIGKSNRNFGINYEGEVSEGEVYIFYPRAKLGAFHGKHKLKQTS